ncbi:P-loop NTPase fold protein [Clostridium perfringens]
MNDEEILQVLTDYVEDTRYKQAVLLDGEWGSGKTFFVKYFYK